MEFEEIDKLISETLNKRYPKKTERRDYYKLEDQWSKEYATKHLTLLNYGDSNGIMYLVDVDFNHYIDVRILKSSVLLTFRRDDLKYMHKSFSYDKFTKDHLSFFLYSIDSLFEVDKLFGKFNKGEIPIHILRDNKISEILK